MKDDYRKYNSMIYLCPNSHLAEDEILEIVALRFFEKAYAP